MSETFTKIWAGRAQLLGDTVSVLPAISYIKNNYGVNTQIVFPIAKKCSQGAPLYLGHPDISEIFLLDGQEGIESERDKAKYNSCHLRFEINPQHPDARYPREFNIYSESWRMIGLPIEEWDKLTPEQQRPKLYKWWNCDPLKLRKGYKNRKMIGIWPQAGYSRENKRNPSREYWVNLIGKLQHWYCIALFGAETDWKMSSNTDYEIRSHIDNYTHLSFFDQIKLSLDCDLCITTDSGSGLILGAYEIPQVSIIPIHWGNDNNPSALSSNNPNNHSFYSFDGTDNIDMDLVLAKIHEKVDNKE